MMNHKKLELLFYKIQKWLKEPIFIKVQSIARRYYEYKNIYFSKINSLDFEGYIPCTDLTVDSQLSKVNGTAYQAYGSYYFFILINFALMMNAKPKYFIDIGCGKGKQCIYAKKYFDFNSIIGIDFSKELIDIANNNLSSLNFKNIRFYLADAIKWRLPDDYCMVFLYNPFSEIILEKFILNNLDNFIKHGSVICYANDMHRNILINSGFQIIYRDHQHNSLYRLN